MCSPRVSGAAPCGINETELPVLDVRSLGDDFVESAARIVSRGQQVEHPRSEPRVRDILGARSTYGSAGRNTARRDGRR